MKKPTQALVVPESKSVARVILPAPPPPGFTPAQAEKFRAFQQLMLDLGRAHVDGSPGAESNTQ